MTWSAIDLPWLPGAPDDFRKQCEAVERAMEPAGPMLRRLAAFALDINQLTRLAKCAARCAATKRVSDLTPFTLGIVGNGTNSLLGPALSASGLRHGIALKIIEAPFDQTLQWTLDPQSPLNVGKPDAVLFAFDHRIIPSSRDLADGNDAERVVQVALSHIESARAGLRSGCGAPVIFQTLSAPPDRILGSFDVRLPGSRRAVVEEFNRRLLGLLDTGPDVLFDVAGLAQTVGLENWHDDPQWFMAKLSFSQSVVPLYADHLARLAGAMRGKSRKCLVLDLDNTLWGGVVGDDGLDGIAIGKGSAAGEAYLDLQLAILGLRSLGVVLAVSSKNDMAIARTPFAEHPDMAIRESDIAVFQANWENKASNLEAIAAALDIGIDALVLLDDNPAERAQVRAALPAVAVPELPPDPALFKRTLLAAGYFEAVALSDEDRNRADYYRGNAQRQELAVQTRDLGEFLKSLQMEISFAEFSDFGRSRVAQLINKSNQFNLTTRRYTEANIAEMSRDRDIFTLEVRLADVFGDNGMISSVICRTKGTAWEIDTWVMSCRVLGRCVEEAMLAEIVSHARSVGIKTIVGHYLPTARNGLVRDHFAKLGFAKIAEDEAGATEWSLAIDAYEQRDLPILVKRVEGSRVA